LNKKLLFLLSGFFCLLQACGKPGYDGTTAQGQAAAIDAVNIALSSKDCATAIAIIDPIYESANSNNDIRMARAAAYACVAGVNFFGLIGQIASNSSKLDGPEFWSLLTQLFPSSTAPTDRVVEGAEGAADALMATLNAGLVLSPTNMFNALSFNPDSAAYPDRTVQSNLFLVFSSMAWIGGMNNRFGQPVDPVTFHKGSNLPWVTADAAGMSTDGCAYAAAVVNFVDSLSGISGSFTGSTAANFTKIQNAFQDGIYLACDLGCQNIPFPGGSQSGCNPTTSCESCPITLRNRGSCTGAVNDANSCAAAGIINFMNNPPTGWPGPP
jgi:hypothetical protein